MHKTWDQFASTLTRFSDAERALIKKAFDLSVSSHAGQMRASGDPYITHPVAVAEKLITLKLDAPAIAAALLHDVLEDTELTKEEVERELGSEVAFLVESLTKFDRVRYRGFERAAESMRKMFLAVAQDIRVVIIKLADRLHNMHTIGALAPEKQKRISAETLEIYAPLAYRLGMGEMKGELEDLAFPIIYPAEAKKLANDVKKILPQRTEYVSRVAPIVERELGAGGVAHFTVNFREKHYYSLWKKLQRYDNDLSRIADLVALRIIVDTVEQCYQALGIIHATWRPVPGRIKDYISMPKPNGYQSLHTTVFCEDDIVAEFQIRTRAMHEAAEVGVTAHWAYVEGGKNKAGVKVAEEKIAWIRKLQEWQQDFAEGASNEDFVEALKIDFFKDRIFVLTPRGEVIDLPEGATPIDFAYHVHSEIGDRMTGAKVNGKMVPFTYALASGDTAEVITAKNAKPKPDWLTIARSTVARGHIRVALRRMGIEPVTVRKSNARAPKHSTLKITRVSRVGLLKEIVTLLTKEKINMQKTDADAQNPVMTIECIIPKACDTKKLTTRLRRIKGVKLVELTP
ncbi:MAG: bifunctional (p)ppGpp synthetase/guanosine-3',5'-bis(diphosphate) 3'-pyrophosphohydrolase [Candidatus Ryanbacteria bacterium]|nr:bifunctional (p)ppGpp synthetase/guanosine-3',5'-bis(diphosphate) 3'-pyrophosphohydrolase [Candidatus Ryanbacteria bacterium]